jgi:hypothetical protein
MPIETREITSRETWLDWRKQDITASVAACLYGDDIHPYTTAYQEWAVHSGLVAREKLINPKLARRGEVIERIAPDIIREERPDWTVGPSGAYYRDPDARIGATPDLQARRPDIEGIGAIQVKSVGPQAFRKWKDRDTGETALPTWISIQANIEAALMGAQWACVVPITIGDHGLDVEIIDVPLVPEFFESFRLHAQEFWRRVSAKEPYPINWGKDAATILAMFEDHDGSIIDLTNDEDIPGILEQRALYKDIERDGEEAEKTRKLYDAQLIQKMGNHSGLRFGSTLVKVKTVRVKEAVRKAYSYPLLTVTGAG